jgi:hypothetical protein
MGRLHLAVGTRYEREGRTFLVLQVLRDGRLVVEDQSGGGQGVVTRDEVTAAWERGALRFAVRGPGVRARGGGGVGHGVHDRRCPPGGGGGAVSRGQAASGLALSPTLRIRRLGGGWSMLRHVGADLHDDRILLEQVLLEPLAFVQHGLGIEQRLLRPCVAGLAEHVLPHQDDEHEDELRHTRQEEQKRERIGVKAEQAEEGQRHPAELDDGGQVERPHRTHAMRDERRDRAIQADVLVLDAAWPDRFAGFDPGVRLRLDQGDALGQHQIPLPQMVVELTDRAQDGLRIVIRLHHPEVGAAAQHPLPDEDDEDKQELDDVAKEEQKREGIGIGRAQGAEARQSDPPANEDQGEIHGPHGAGFFCHPHGELVVDTAVRGGLRWGVRGRRGLGRGAWKGRTQGHKGTS